MRRRSSIGNLVEGKAKDPAKVRDEINRAFDPATAINTPVKINDIEYIVGVDAKGQRVLRSNDDFGFTLGKQDIEGLYLKFDNAPKISPNGANNQFPATKEADIDAQSKKIAEDAFPDADPKIRQDVAETLSDQTKSASAIQDFLGLTKSQETIIITEYPPRKSSISQADKAKLEAEAKQRLEEAEMKELEADLIEEQNLWDDAFFKDNQEFEFEKAQNNNIDPPNRDPPEVKFEEQIKTNYAKRQPLINPYAIKNVLANALNDVKLRLKKVEFPGNRKSQYAKLDEEVDLSDPKVQEKVGKEMETKNKRALSLGKISQRVYDALNWQASPQFKRRAKIALVLGIVGGAVGTVIASAITHSQSSGAVEHQNDLNGCYLYDRLTNTKTKIELLSCGSATTGVMMPTCPTQSFSATTSTAQTITKCPTNTFNPCAKASKSRSADPAVPLVPNVCDLYLYKKDAPPTIAGVTVRDACKTEDNKDLPADQACSVYCKTENFNLPATYELQCVQVSYEVAYADLLQRLDYDLTEIFPPAEQTKSKDVSKTLAIIAGVLGVIFLVLIGVYYFRKS